MRSKEIILEYDRTRALQALGDNLWLAAARDSMRVWNMPMSKMKEYLTAVSKDHPKIIDLLQTPSIQQNLSNKVLTRIEEIDPTTGKKYTQWVARQFALGNVPKLEDVLSTTGEYLIKFDKLNRKKLLKSPYNDITRFKNMNDFMNILDQYELPEEENTNKGLFKEVYNDGNVRIIVPEDEAAACYWGQGTRWCTAATKSENYFNYFNKQGPMYILLPKTPHYKGEKYQVHFYSSQFMDEKDDPVNPYDLLTKRFEDLFIWFKNIPEIAKIMQGTVMFASNTLLSKLSNDASKLLHDIIMKYYSLMERNDSEYLIWLRDNGYDKDFDGNIDWESAPSYDEYSSEAKEWLEGMDSAVNPTPDEIRNAAMILSGRDGDMSSILNFEEIISICVEKTELSYSHEIASWISKNIFVKIQNDDYVIGITKTIKNIMHFK